MYGQMEASMKDTVMIALKLYRRDGDDEIDGPRTDVTRRVWEILQPSSQYLQECITRIVSYQRWTKSRYH